MAVIAASASPIRWNPLAIAATLALLVCATPALAVIVMGASPTATTAALGGDLVRDGVVGTLSLVILGGAGATILGAAAACLVSLCTFPGRGVFKWLLATPLAAPAYVLSYAYSSLTWAGGPLDAPIMGVAGAAMVYTLGFYPYVYLAVRAALARQSAHALEAARTLGAGPWRVIGDVALPMARPGLVAGAALAMMEIAADYGAAQHFGVTTMATAIFRAWYAHGALHLAAQISALLLGAAFMFLLIERRARGRAGFAAGMQVKAPRYQLTPLAGFAAFGFCTLLFGLAVALPMGWLAHLALLQGSVGELARPLANSLMLAGGGAGLTLACALAIAAAARRAGAIGQAAMFAASLGYAAPGAVIAMGALALFGAARDAGLVGGFGGALALGVLLWSYAARFAAAGVQPIEAGLMRLSAGLDASARLLGAGPMRRLWRIDAPIAAPSIAAAALIVFSEILKELPATLILRPFDFDTLAVTAYAYASDERLLQAAAPALLIFASGLAPILLVTTGVWRRSGR